MSEQAQPIKLVTPNTGPDAGTADPTDGRRPYEWDTHYPAQACKLFRQEAWYITALLFTSLLLILAAWKAYPAEYLGVSGAEAVTLRKYCLYSFSGLLGGVIFDLKYLYRSVARGWWHVDRRLWRFLSPFTSLCVAFVVGALIDSNFISVRTSSSGASIVGTGFLIGYFADTAVAKLHEIAEVLFGPTKKPSSDK